MSKPTQVAPAEPLAVPFKRFYSDVYPMSRAKANKLVASGELKTFLDGSRRMVLMSDARAYVERRASAGGAVPPEVTERKRAAGKIGIEKLRARAKARTAEAAP